MTGHADVYVKHIRLCMTIYMSLGVSGVRVKCHIVVRYSNSSLVLYTVYTELCLRLGAF